VKVLVGIVTLFVVGSILFAFTRDEETATSFTATKYRWAVKTGVDASPPAIDDVVIRNAKLVTVSEMNTWTIPKKPKGFSTKNLRLKPYENQVYAVEGTITKYRISKDDQDIHVVLTGSDSATVICELADPSVVLKSSPWRTRIALTRSKFFEIFKPKSTWKTSKTRVRFVGPAFFDKPHGQVGLAKNGVEIHPVLSLTVL
jgi:hypothetical protein